jgi:hypothetical protein
MRRESVPASGDHAPLPIADRRPPSPGDDDLVARVAAACRTPRRYEFHCCDAVVTPAPRPQRKRRRDD